MRRVESTGWFFCLFALFAVQGCLCESALSTPPSPSLVEPLELEVLYSGCREVLRGPICVLPEDRRLNVWARPSRKAELAWRLGAQSEQAEPVLVDGGVRFEIVVEEGAKRLQLGESRGSENSAWSLTVAHRPELPVLSKAQTLRANGKPDEARSILESAVPSLDFGDKARAQSAIARILLHKGDIDEALALFSTAIDAHLSAGQISQAVLDTSAQVFTLIYNGRRFGEARRALLIENETQGFAPCVFSLAEVRAQLAVNLDRLGEALDESERGLRAARRAALLDSHRNMMQVKGLTLLALGRRKEAIELFREELETLPPTAREVARLMANTNLGWAVLTALEAGDRPGLSPKEYLENAVRLSGGTTGSRRIEQDLGRVNAQVNLALAAFHEGRLADAEAHLAAARGLGAKRNPTYELWCLDIEGRLLAAKGNYALAAEKYRSMEDLARTSVAHESVFRAITAKAAVLATAGRTNVALGEYARADESLNEAALRVGLSDGRATFLAQRDHALKKYLSLLLDTGHAEEAMELTRRSHRRLLSGEIIAEQMSKSSPEALAEWENAVAAYRTRRAKIDDEAKEDWRLTKKELASVRDARSESERAFVHELDRSLLAVAGVNARLRRDFSSPGESALLAFAREAQGFSALLTDAKGTTFARVQGEKDSSLTEEAARLLTAKLTPRAAASSRLLILANDEVQSLDVHALEIDGEPLIAKIPVLYTLDLPERSSPSPDASNSALAVIVSDPEGNLSHARREGHRLAEELRAQGKEFVALTGSDVTRESLSAAIDGAYLFHFAGHAQPDVRRGWGSALRLKGNTFFSPADVLSLDGPPRLSVLLGCGTAVARGETGSVMGVSQALLVAGGENVIATSKELPDTAAARFSEVFYEYLGRSTPPVDAFREAALVMRKTYSDWGAFRLYVR